MDGGHRAERLEELAVALRVLPAVSRARYAEEWRDELGMLGWWAQLRYAGGFAASCGSRDAACETPSSRWREIREHGDGHSVDGAAARGR
jgi:hypothetical protein